jgi:uncharacterized membrane protein YphA (DoxX/SURF4 family)
MLRSTALFLVLLRLAIGWHFLFEGLDKVHSLQIGSTETNRPFSSAGYFREATGPLGGWMRGAIGDPYEEARTRFALAKRPDGPMEKPYELIPPALARDWDDYAKRFTEFYLLDEVQKEQAARRLLEAKSAVVVWMTWSDKKGPFADDKEKEAKGLRKVKKTFPTGVVELDETVPERLAEYNTLLDEVRQTDPEKRWKFGKDVEKLRILKAKIDLEQQRAALIKDLGEKTAAMKKSLADVLTPKQLALGTVPEAPVGSFLAWLDWLTAYGLTVLGACLILGLLTRTSCVLLAGFLLMTYLAVPAFPWLPVPPNNEGNYYYVNKNLIELLALLALATTASGRWLGLDALFHYFLAGDSKKISQEKPDALAPKKPTNTVALTYR